MMRQMRQNTKIIMLVTALAFVALMVFEWGMDASGRSSGGGDLGRVGSTNVSLQVWQDAYRNLYDQVQRSQDGPISVAQNREIEDRAWDEVVNQILIRHELKRRGIQVSDEEIRQAARFSPPPELRQDPAFLTDGVFDFQRYQAFLAQAAASSPDFLVELERYYREVIPRSKLLRQVTSGVFISDALLWTDYRDRNEQATVRFVAFDADRVVSDGEVQVSAAEIEQYYRENRDRFEVPGRAEVLYTFLGTAPTAADSVAALERAEAIRAELLAGEDFTLLARAESDDPGSAREGGALGRFGRGVMVEPFEEAVFSLPLGTISQPIRTSFGYHLIEVTARDGDEAEARHILFGFRRTDASEIRLLTQVDSLEALGRNRPLSEAAQTLGLPVFEGQLTENFAFLPEIGLVSEAQDWVFEELEPVGSVSPVFETSEAFYMVELVSRAPAGVLPLEEVRSDIEGFLRVRKKSEVALERANRFAAELRSGAIDLETLAEREGLSIETPEPFTRATFVPGLGSANAAIGAAFGRAPGGIAAPVRLGGRIVLMEVLERQEADRAEFEEIKPFFRAQLTQEIRQQRLELWIEGLRETTRIVDRRAEFFRSLERLEEQGARLPAFF
jgi:peptidyl-prolyl cis-trans isomerase D